MRTEHPLAETIGGYVVSESVADVEAATRTHLRHLVLDSVAVSLGGTQLPQGRRMVEFWEPLAGDGAATAYGASRRLPAPVAAYLNSYLANLLDFDDTYSGRAIGHPGATVVQPALAVAEREDATGREFLDSVLAGYEASIRIGDAIMPTPERSRQVAATATWQVFGATVAASRLLGSDAGTVAHALGLTGVSAPVPAVRKVGIEDDEHHDLKNNYGWASMAGVKASLLAESGFSGNRTIFDGEKGFWRMAASDSFDESLLRSIPGEERLVKAVAFKPYSSCRWSHATLDCLADLDLSPDATVDSVRVETFHEAATLDDHPESVVDAQFSIPYVVAVHLLGVPTGYEWLRADRVRSREVQELAGRVTLVADPEMTAAYEATGRMGARVTVRLADGTELEASVEDPLGDPGNPMPYERVRAKYDSLVEPLLGEARAAELKERVLSLESEDSVRDLGGLLSPLERTVQG
jgi:2-methylcitrate dehydratase PrpD